MEEVSLSIDNQEKYIAEIELKDEGYSIVEMATRVRTSCWRLELTAGLRRHPKSRACLSSIPGNGQCINIRKTGVFISAYILFMLKVLYTDCSILDRYNAKYIADIPVARRNTKKKKRKR